MFSASFTACHGDRYLTQRVLERRSLASTVDHFRADCDPDELAEMLFEHWRNPPLFADAVTFLESIEVPVVVVSNIDRYDINAAVVANDLQFERVITSEDVRSYKPRPELFAAGLAALGTAPETTLHIGDSVTSDVIGANRLGIPVAWVNRSARPRPRGASPQHTLTGLHQLLPIVSPTAR